MTYCPHCGGEGWAIAFDAERRPTRRACCQCAREYYEGERPKSPHQPAAHRDDPEHRQQVALFQWARLWRDRYPCLDLLYAVPNGGARSKATAGRLKAEGVKAGVPDTCLPVARDPYHGLYIELKAEGGKPTPMQRIWLDRLTIEGYAAGWYVGWVAAANAIVTYLGLPDECRPDSKER